MAHHFFNLLKQSLYGMPELVSSNWLAWALGLFVFVVYEISALLVCGWQDMKQRWKQNVAFGIAAATAGYIVLFGISVVRTVYDDHQSLVAQVSKFRSAGRPQLSSAQGDQYLEVKRDIQNKLSLFLKGENKLRDEWRIAMGQPDKTLQPTFASKAKQNHSDIDAYLRTIPRGSVYSARFNGYRRTVCAGYPLGHIDETCGELETLEADTNALGEFIKDPDLGRP